MYYEMSQYMETETLNYDFAVEVYNTVKFNIIPICKKLMNSSRSNEILITEETYAELLNKLNDLDQRLNNPNASEIINIAKTDLNNFKNKSIYYVYNSFQD